MQEGAHNLKQYLVTQGVNNQHKKQVVQTSCIRHGFSTGRKQFDFKIQIRTEHNQTNTICLVFLASQDALEVMLITHLLSHSLSVSIHFTDVTLVSDDTYWDEDEDI